ncbi:hypothetical protein ACFLTR_01655 [Chloroflexota bacterium]
MNAKYEVLNPWAEVDPIPLKGLSPRLTDLDGKTVGLLSNAWHKVAAHPILAAVEEELKARFPTAKFSWFDKLMPSQFGIAVEIKDTEYKAEFEEWIKGVDAAVSAVAS